MSEFERVAYVTKSGPSVQSFTWEDVKNRPITGGGTWPKALECDRLSWEREPLDVIGNYDLYLANIFPGSYHIEHIRQAQPDAVIVAMPDPHLERLLGEGNTRILQHMQMADLVGGRTKYDAATYGALLDMRAIWLPSPIGPSQAFLPYMVDPKKREDYIITVDHRSNPGWTAQNVAVVAALQRATGLDVVYAKHMGYTPHYASLAGMSGKFLDQVKYKDFLGLVAKARIGVDMYAGHAMHRHGLTHAILGTPLVTSSWTNPTGAPACDPYDSYQAVELALRLLEHPDEWEAVRQEQFRHIDELYSWEVSQERIRQIMRDYHLM